VLKVESLSGQEAAEHADTGGGWTVVAARPNDLCERSQDPDIV